MNTVTRFVWGSIKAGLWVALIIMAAGLFVWFTASHP